MDKERKAQIDWCLNNETNAPETQEWRDELTPEEQEYVDQQDDHFERAIAAMCSARLVVERLRKKYKRSGEQYMARLGKDGGLVLERA